MDRWQKKGDPISPRTPEDNEQVRRQRVDQIQEAARRVFAYKGLSATKIADIAREAGISHGLIYHYFRGKEEIFTAIVEQALQGARQVTAAAKQRPGTPWYRISWLFTVMVQGAQQSPDFLLIAIQAASAEVVPPEVRRLMEEHGERIFGDVVELISEGQQAGEVVEGDPRVLATALLSSVQGLAISAVTGSNDPNLAPDPELLLRMLKA